ncbi:MAG: tyrosine recombinase XerC [Ruminococcaceae bacterium]|nr:tyrosine recombinase XerC [Oscillospiraceae bacterium]
MPDLSNIYIKCPVFLKDYLTYMSVIKGKSQNTIKEYFYDLRMFLRYVLYMNGLCKKSELNSIDIAEFDFKYIERISLSDLYAFMAYVNNEHSSNDCYRARKVASLKSFFNYLTIKDKSLKLNPAANLETPKIKKRMPKYLTLEQSISFLKVIDGEFKDRDLAIFVLFLNCGLRLSELVGINLKDFDLDKRTLKVIGKGNKERVVYLNDICVDALTNYLKVRPVDQVNYEDRDALFLSNQLRRISNRMVEILAKKYFKKANLDYDMYTPHKLRHTAATIMYRDGDVDIRTLQELLGHASLSTTQLYTHVKNDDLKQAADKNPLANIKIE